MPFLAVNHSAPFPRSVRHPGSGQSAIAPARPPAAPPPARTHTKTFLALGPIAHSQGGVFRVRLLTATRLHFGRAAVRCRARGAAHAQLRLRRRVPRPIGKAGLLPRGAAVLAMLVRHGQRAQAPLAEMAAQASARALRRCAGRSHRRSSPCAAGLRLRGRRRPHVFCIEAPLCAAATRRVARRATARPTALDTALAALSAVACASTWLAGRQPGR